MCARGKYIYVLLLSALFGLEIEGTVTDRETGLPIPSATIKAGGNSTSTDLSGKFTLRGVTPETELIEASHIAYQSRTKPIASHINFELPPKVEDLEPVKVKGRTSTNRIRIVNKKGEDNAAFLGQLASVEIGEGRTANIKVRGSEDILIIVDGREIPPDHLGDIDLSNIAGNIESAELITENIPARYSAKAPQAVLLIATKSIDTKLRATAGSFGSFGIAANTGTHHIDLSLKGGMTEGDFPYQYRRIPESQPETRTRQNNDRKKIYLSSRIEQGLLMSRVRNTADLSIGWLKEGMPGDLDHPTPEAERQLVNLALHTNTHLIGSGLDLSLNMQRGWSNICSPTPYVYVPIDADHHTDMIKLTLNWHRDITDFLVPSAGFEFSHEGYRMSNNINHDNDLHRVSRNLPRLYGQISTEKVFWQTIIATLTPGLSLDIPEEGKVFSPQIEGGISAGLKGIRLGLSSGWRSAYRSPSFTDLYWQRDAFSEGNQDLAAERSESAHLRIFGGIERSFVNLNISFDIWQTVTDSVISWNRGFDGLYRPVNLGTEMRQGQDHLLRLSLWETLHFTWSNTLIETEHMSGDRYLNGKALPFVPSHLEKWEAGFTKWGISAYFRGISKGKEYTLPANTKWNEAYTLHSAGLSYTHSFRALDMTTGLNLSNIMDVQYETMPGYPGTGRNYELIIQIKRR